MRKVFLTLLVGAAAACSSGSKSTSKTGAEGELDGGISVVPIGDAGPPKSDAEPPADAGKPDAADNLGSLVVVDLADVPCQAPGGSASEVTPASPGGPLYDRLGAVGTRRFAVSTDGLQLFTFGGPSGSSTPAPDVIDAAGEGSSVAALVKVGGALSLQRFDVDGNATGGAIALAAHNDWQTIVAGTTKTLAVWSNGGAMAAALFDPGGAITANVDLGADTGGSGTYAIDAVPSGTGFLVVWTRNRADGKLETLQRRIEADGTTTAPSTLILATGDHLLVGLAPMAGGGAAMLLNEGLPAKDAVLVRIDPQGAVVEPGIRLSGSGSGFGVASNNGELGVVAIKGSRSAFRAIAADGSALGPWVCLDDSDGGASFYPTAAIDSDDAGYATLARVTNGAAIFRRVDRLGAGL